MEGTAGLGLVSVTVLVAGGDSWFGPTGESFVLAMIIMITRGKEKYAGADDQERFEQIVITGGIGGCLAGGWWSVCILRGLGVVGYTQGTEGFFCGTG